MKHIAPFFAVILLLSCRLLTPQPIDSDALNTAVYLTAWVYAQQTVMADIQTATHTPTVSPTTALSPTPFLTPSPFPAKIESLLQDKCEMPWHQVTGNFAVKSPGLFERYTNTGCRLPIFSPNGKHLAYLTPARLENQDLYVETVKILQTGSEKVQIVHFAHDMSYIHNLEWSPTGQLVIWERIWEGPWFILIYDPASTSIVTTMRLDSENHLWWNTARTVVFAGHPHAYGASACIHELRGYDFAYGNPFPDFYEIFNLEKNENDPLGIPNGKSDDLAVEALGWSSDERYVWITISLLHKSGDGFHYEVGPKQAGILEFRKEGVKFTLLASDPRFDYSFDEAPDTTIVASPYQPHLCP